MNESLQLIQKEIEFVLDRIGLNHPLREHLIIANGECNILIENERINYRDSLEYNDHDFFNDY